MITQSHNTIQFIDFEKLFGFYNLQLTKCLMLDNRTIS